MSNLSIYLVGFCLLIAGVATAAHLLGAPPVWIGIGAVILLGIGAISGVSRTRIRESPQSDSSAKHIVLEDGD